MSNSHLWKRLGARDIAIFGSHVGPHILNIVYLDAYGGIWGYMKVYGGTDKTSLKADTEDWGGTCGTNRTEDQGHAFHTSHAEDISPKKP